MLQDAAICLADRKDKGAGIAQNNRNAARQFLGFEVQRYDFVR